MAKRLEKIFEYRVLLSKARELGIPLSAEEEARLDRLGQQLPQSVPALDDRDTQTRLSEALPAEFVQAGRFQACTLRNASGAGFAMAAVEPPALGQRLLVHVRSPFGPIEYTFPARVVSRVVRGVAGMGVAFEGLPTQRALGGRASGVFTTEDATPTSRVDPGSTRRGSGS
jgi:hypothetical protein